jgi:hypothetical protein
MSVSSIGVVAVTATTGVSQRPPVEQVEQKSPVFQANAQDKDDSSKRPQPTSELSSPPAPAPTKLTGLLVDKLA